MKEKDNAKDKGGFGYPLLDEVSQKPPIGLIPENIWEQQRIEDLSKAINRYIMNGVFSPQINIWIDELQKRLRNFV